MMGSPMNTTCENCGRSTKDPVLLRPIRCGCDYRAQVESTSSHIGSGRQRLLLGALGLAGECGEVVDLIKKYEFHGKPLNTDDLIKELGDVRWYMECLMMAIHTTIEEVERRNIAKLRKRYPNGFNTADSVARRDEA